MNQETIPNGSVEPIDAIVEQDEIRSELERPSTALVAMAQREIEASVLLARRFPRDEDAAFQRLMRTCRRSGFAERAEYAYPRGGKTIRGLSVYFAREAAKVWGNLHFGFSIIDDTEESRTIRAFAWDLETNARNHAEDWFKKLVQRRRGDETVWVVPDERDLRELTNKRAAILVRNCVLQIIPDDIKAEAIDAVRKTKSDRAAKDPDKARKDILNGFDGINVSAEELEEYLGCKVAQASPTQLVELREVYTSIRDGNSTWREHLSAVQEQRIAEAPDDAGGDLPGARAKRSS